MKDNRIQSPTGHPRFAPKVQCTTELKAATKTEPKLEHVAAACKQIMTPKPTAMPTPFLLLPFADAAYAKRLGDLGAVTKQNLAEAAMKWDGLEEDNVCSRRCQLSDMGRRLLWPSASR